MSKLRLRGLRARNLRSVDIDFPHGKWSALFGPSGAGKSGILFGALEPVARKRFRILDDSRSLPSGSESWLEGVADSVTGLQPLVAWEGEVPRNRKKTTLVDALQLWPVLVQALQEKGKRRCLQCSQEWAPPSIEEALSLVRKFQDGSSIIIYSDASSFDREQLLASGWTRAKTSKGLERLEEMPHCLPEGTWLLVDRFRWKTERFARLEVSLGEAWTRMRPMRVEFGASRVDFFPPHQCPNCGVEQNSELPASMLCLGGEGSLSFEQSWLLNGISCQDWRKACLQDWFELSSTLESGPNRQLNYLVRAGLGHLGLNRELGTLSLGEARRLELSVLLSQVRCEQLVLFDEPGMGLHGLERRNLVQLLGELVAQGNTVITADPSREFLEGADSWFRLGPGGGPRGGQVVAKGLRDELSGVQDVFPPTRTWVIKEQVVFSDLNTRFIQIPILKMPLQTVVGIAGVSGSGKTTLLEEELIPRIRAGKNFEGTLPLGGVTVLLERALGSAAISTVATLSGTWTAIRTAFTEGEEGRIRGLSPSDLIALSGKGACPTCRGHGVDSDALPCPDCDGLGLRADLLELRLRGRSLKNWLQTPIQELSERIPRDGQLRRCILLLNRLGMGERSLGERGRYLSLGERSRIALAKELARGRADRPKLFVLDEPCLGLPMEEARMVLEVFRSLTEEGHSFWIVEHNELFLRAADWILELGPGAGKEGGQLVFSGTPADIANGNSPTGRWLNSKYDGEVSSVLETPQPKEQGGILSESRNREGRLALEGALWRELATRSPLVSNLVLPELKDSFSTALSPTAWPTAPQGVTTLLSVLGIEDLMLRILHQEGKARCLKCGGRGPWVSLFEAARSQKSLRDAEITWTTTPTFELSGAPSASILLAAGFRRLKRNKEVLLLRKGVKLSEGDEVLLDKFTFHASPNCEQRVRDLEHHASLLGGGNLRGEFGEGCFSYQKGACADCGTGNQSEAGEVAFSLGGKFFSDILLMDCSVAIEHFSNEVKEPTIFQRALDLLKGSSLNERSAGTSWSQLQELEQKLARLLGWILFPVEGVSLIHDQALAGLPVKLANFLASELKKQSGHLWTNAEGYGGSAPSSEDKLAPKATSPFSLALSGDQWAFPNRATSMDSVGKALGLQPALRTQFSSCEEARQKGWGPNNLVRGNPDISCPDCQGRGGHRPHPELFAPCPRCDGTGWNAVASRLELRGLTWRGLGQASLEQAAKHFAETPSIALPAGLACQMGMGHYCLGEPLQRLPLGDRSMLPLLSYLAEE
ncbi:MAG: hypothetical protein QF524_04405, partial [Planctomycetota bacterium]|nr:hypothetical protein [Planctomycetota bacterium]